MKNKGDKILYIYTIYILKDNDNDIAWSFSDKEACQRKIKATVCECVIKRERERVMKLY